MKVFAAIPCKVCDTTFRPKGSKQVCCSDICRDKRKVSSEKDKVTEHLSKYFELKKGTDKRQILKLIKSQKYIIKNEQTIENYDSPTGKAYIGVAKKPLQAVTDGYGYKGVLIQTDNRMFIQCHACGKWMRKIDRRHLAKHKLNKPKYQEKFGLLKGTALVADATSYKLEAAAMKKYEMFPEQEIARLEKQRANSIKQSKKKITGSKLSDKIEYQNRYATCEKQIGFRLIEYIRKYKNLPSPSNKNEGRSITKVLQRRYGSVNQGFKHYGLPTLYRTGTNVELLAPNGKQLFFNYNREYSRDRVFDWMVQQCPMLDPVAINKFKD